MYDIHGTREELVAMIVNAKAIHDEQLVRIVKLEKALQKIADLVDSEAGEPLDEAIDIANKALQQ